MLDIEPEINTYQNDIILLNLAISPDAAPEADHYFRSDHFSFAHVGIPAFSIEHATEFAGKPAGFGAQAYQEYNRKHYHQP